MNARERSLLRKVVSKRSPENIKLVDNLFVHARTKHIYTLHRERTLFEKGQYLERFL